jgi:hypothetical protein
VFSGDVMKCGQGRAQAFVKFIIDWPCGETLGGFVFLAANPMAQVKLRSALMWRRAIVAFLSSVLGAGVGIGLLYGAFVYICDGEVGEGVRMNILVSVHIFAALSLAAAIWGSIVGGIKMGVRAGFVCLGALILSGCTGFGLLMLTVQYVGKPDLLILWPITAVGATIAGVIGGAFMGWGLGGKRLWRRAALVGAIPTGLIFAFPLTTALLVFVQSVALLLLFIPFIILATYLGVAIHPSAQSPGIVAGPAPARSPITEPPAGY